MMRVCSTKNLNNELNALQSFLNVSFYSQNYSIPCIRHFSFLPSLFFVQIFLTNAIIIGCLNYMASKKKFCCKAFEISKLSPEKKKNVQMGQGVKYD